MSHRASYWKTTVMAAVVAAASGLSILWLSIDPSIPFRAAVLIVPSLLFAASFAAVIGGLICLWRDAREIAGKPDLFVQFANRVIAGSLLSKLGFRFLMGRKLRPGDLVRVRPLSEIEATLDDSRQLNGLPFMAEMEAYCGKVFIIHRRVDKINDMRHKTGLRRMHHTVALDELRCSGHHHGGCQAECQILWKDGWLKRLPDQKAEAALQKQEESWSTPDVNRQSVQNGDRNTYVCQMTELWDASHPMSQADFRQDLRTIFSGNLGIGAFLIAMFTRLFNYVQSLRGGAGYPFMPAQLTLGPSPTTDLQLNSKDRVVVRSKQEIAKTLVNNRNKGLWFDRDMIRFCNQPATIRKRIDRIIDESTGKVITLTTPCVVLEEGIATGEFLRFCPQHEYIFWREIWLRRED